MIEVKLRNTKLDGVYVLDDPGTDFIAIGFANGGGSYRGFNDGDGELLFSEVTWSKDHIIPLREYLERTHTGPVEDGIYAGRDGCMNCILVSYDGRWFDYDGCEQGTLVHVTVTDRIGDIPSFILKSIKEYLENNE